MCDKAMCVFQAVRGGVCSQEDQPISVSRAVGREAQMCTAVWDRAGELRSWAHLPCGPPAGEKSWKL